MKMEMNHWEWEGMGLKKTFPLIFVARSHYWLPHKLQFLYRPIVAFVGTSSLWVCQF